MARVIVIRNTYGGILYLKKAINYVSDSRAQYRGGYGVNPFKPTDAFYKMIQIRQKYGKVSGNPLVHIVVSYDKTVKDIETAGLFGKECAKYFADRFQVIFCSHESDNECPTFHTHIIVNSVSYIDGRMIITGHDEVKKFCDYVSEVTGQYTQFYFKNKAEYK
ncbi:MAG: relaxase/mobilization nuclease domain-containing protein [Porcipelethomonas sp.]